MHSSIIKLKGMITNRFVLLTISFLIPIISFSQSKSELDVFKHTAIDTTQLTVSYELTFKYDITGTENPRQDKVYTYIGHRICHSFVESERSTDLNMAAQYQETGSRGSRAAMLLASNVGEIYTNYPKGKFTVIYNMDGAGSYLYEETTPKMPWKISTEHKTVLGYNCTAATCKYRGREYKAWFTTDIPLSYGPWKFAGLPGLIMEVKTQDGDYHWIATGIEKPKEVKPIYFLDRTYVKTTREKTRKQEHLLLKDPATYLESYGIEFTVISFSGETVKLKLFTFENPIEKE